MISSSTVCLELRVPRPQSINETKRTPSWRDPLTVQVSGLDPFCEAMWERRLALFGQS